MATLLTDIIAPSSVVTLDGTQTLTNKTLTSPVISTISNTGTLTLPTTTDTLVGRATTDNLTNKTIVNGTLTNPTINNGMTVSGSASISGLIYPASDGTAGQVLSTNGSGQLTFATVSGEGGVVVGGYNNSSLTSFPAGDLQGTDSYIGSSGSAYDAFGISLLATFTCMDPVGSTQTTDLGVLT